MVGAGGVGAWGGGDVAGVVVDRGAKQGAWIVTRTQRRVHVLIVAPSLWALVLFVAWVLWR